LYISTPRRFAGFVLVIREIMSSIRVPAGSV
jgi:hypothetical protein